MGSADTNQRFQRERMVEKAGYKGKLCSEAFAGSMTRETSESGWALFSQPGPHDTCIKITWSVVQNANFLVSLQNQ